MDHRLLLVVALVLGAGPGLAQAASPEVIVTLGPAVQARSGELGRSELEDQRRELQRDVQSALARSHQSPARVRLVIQDIEPNRPTSGQLGLNAQLSKSSFGLGGAAITGEIVQADGSRQPIRYRFFQTDLANETNFTTWGDAGEAYDTLSQAIGALHVPDDQRPWPAPRPPQVPTGTRLPN